MNLDKISWDSKIRQQHYDRLAIIYVRQSTIQQIEKHTESTKLQYGLVNRAKQLGWVEQRILVIDEDLGISGASAEGRPGFQRLVAEVSLDHVGLVLGIEMSRLARSCRDWHQLLEVCALFDTLIGDVDGIYDPKLYNDRLLLGLKGTMSEAELHILKQRMLEGRNAKARRGELWMRLPIGYAWDASGTIQKDPDEQAQSVTQLIFTLFDRLQTVGSVLNYFVKNKIQLPYRFKLGAQAGELRWLRPNRTTLLGLLHNPIYTGAYVFGRRSTDFRKKKPGRPSTGKEILANPQAWQVLLKDHIPAYITWEQYERNLQQLKKNASKNKGTIRKGSSLLSGLLVCGHCGLRMSTKYINNGSGLRYNCNAMRIRYADPLCQSLKGDDLDALITDLILEVLQPAALEVSLKVAEDLEAEHIQLQTQWKQREERAHFDVERARRQYSSVEPENRLVARSLERQWEEALAKEEELKADYARFTAQQPLTLSDSEREAIRQLASDIPTLWKDPATSSSDKKAIIRLLIERIQVTVQGNTEKASVEVHWAGGHRTVKTFVRPVGKIEQLSYYPELLSRVTVLNAEGKTPMIIAQILNEEGWLPPKMKKPFTDSTVSHSLLAKIPRTNKKRALPILNKKCNEWTLEELAQKLETSLMTLQAWRKRGELTARLYQATPQRKIWLIDADQAEIIRLQSLKAKPRTWSPPTDRKNK